MAPVEIGQLVDMLRVLSLVHTSLPWWDRPCVPTAFLWEPNQIDHPRISTYAILESSVSKVWVTCEIRQIQHLFKL